MKLPEKEYLRFDELAIQWKCSSRDLFHLVATEKLVPSVLVRGKFDAFQVELDDDGDLIVWPSYIDVGVSAAESLDGIFYLSRGGRVEVHRCAFGYFSVKRSVGNGDVVYRLDEIAELEMIQELKTARISSNVIFVREEIARFENDHSLTGHSANEAEKEVKFPWGTHNTKWLNHLSQAALKFWNLYDPTDPSTAPTNEQVENWLIGRGVPKRTAQVMATILRADLLPTGRRK